MSDQCFSSEDGKVAQVEASLQREVFWALIFELVGLRVQEDVSFLNFLLKRKMSLLIDRNFKRKGTYIFAWDGAVILYADCEEVLLYLSTAV